MTSNCLDSGAPHPVTAAIENAEEVPDEIDGGPQAEKLRLLIEDCSPDRTIVSMRDILAASGNFYERGVPVRLARDPGRGGASSKVMTPDGIVLAIHRACRPYRSKVKPDGSVVETDARLPRSFAVMYLDCVGEWQLPPLNGIASSPLLREDGDIYAVPGYDPVSGMWVEDIPDLAGRIPASPTRADAERALSVVRDHFRTFCFADAQTIPGPGGVQIVDTARPPGRDESAFLVGLMTAVCRPSLDRAPGLLLKAPPLSGAGAGKGLLARCICLVAYGLQPHAVTSGSSAEELEKRIAAELIEGNPVLFLDNLNNTALKSDLLASAITERPARIRVLGRSQMVPINSSSLIILTGNGLKVSEDLTRRFIPVEFDPRTEDPEARAFGTDILADTRDRRLQLLAALLTIWRWGRMAAGVDAGIRSGRPLGSFETWGRWARDPLLALGCQDPANRIGEAKERDSRRQEIARLFEIWWGAHADAPVTAAGLHQSIQEVIDPQGRGRQYVAAAVERLSGTRMAGFHLTRQAATGRWGAATYSLEPTDGREKHRKHRGHRDDDISASTVVPRDQADAPYDPYAIRPGPTAAGPASPMPPMPPMASPADQKSEDQAPDDQNPGWSARL